MLVILITTALRRVAQTKLWITLAVVHRSLQSVARVRRSGDRRAMTSVLDPVELGALARRVDGCADELRGRARGLLLAASVTRWQSTAAEAFRRQAGDLAVAMHTSAVDVDAAAAALRRHGRQVEIVASAIATPLEFVANLAVSWLGG